MRIVELVLVTIFGMTHSLTDSSVMIRSRRDIDEVRVYSNTFSTKKSIDLSEDGYIRLWEVNYRDLDTNKVNYIQVQNDKKKAYLLKVWHNEGYWYSIKE